MNISTLNANVLLHLKCLANDEGTCSVILKDESLLQALVLLLSNTQEEIVSLVLQIFQSLSLYEGNVLTSLTGLKTQLLYLVEKFGDRRSEELYDMSRNLVTSLFPTDEASELSNMDKYVSAKCRPRSVLLQLYGAESEAHIDLVRSRLLSVRGVVSVTFQLNRQRALVYTIPRLNPEVLVHAVCGDNTTKFQSDTQLSEPYSDGPSTKRCPVSVRIVRKRRDNYSMRGTNSRRQSLLSINANVEDLPPYLDEHADLFEVDETRAAPQLVGEHSAERTKSGPISWLTDVFQRSFFW